MAVFRDALHVDELSGARFGLALELLESGPGFVFGNTRVIVDGQQLCAHIPSTWSAEEADEARSMVDLERGSRILSALIEGSARFRDIAEGRTRRVVLIDDYHTGWTPICELVDGDFRWCFGFPRCSSSNW